jgi:transcriptional regulator with XRE-family HTH domain
VLTGAQIRSARALLRWSAQETARRTGVSKRTLDRLEQHDGVPSAHSRTLATIQAAFEAAGIEFIGRENEGPGVRFWQKHDN